MVQYLELIERDHIVCYGNHINIYRNQTLIETVLSAFCVQTGTNRFSIMSILCGIL